jgi:hypothetical protein
MAAIANAIIRATDSFQSVTAIATPGAFAATEARMFASTVSGAVLMGYGTTNDVTIKNRAGTTVIGVTANTVNVTMAGAVLVASDITQTAGTSALKAVTATTVTGVGIALFGTDASNAVRVQSASNLNNAVNPAVYGASGADVFAAGTLVLQGNAQSPHAVIIATSASGTAPTAAVTVNGDQSVIFAGALSGITTLAIGGALTGATTITGSSTLTLNATTTSAILIGSVSTGQVSIARAALVQPVMSGTISAMGTVQNSTPTIAQLLGGIVTQTSVTGAGTVTVPTGTATSTGVTGAATGDTFDCHFFNLGGGFTLTITAGAAGSTIVGNAAVPTGKSVLLRFICTGANTWSTYCIVGA